MEKGNNYKSCSVLGKICDAVEKYTIGITSRYGEFYSIIIWIILRDQIFDDNKDLSLYTKAVKYIIKPYEEMHVHTCKCIYTHIYTVNPLKKLLVTRVGMRS